MSEDRLADRISMLDAERWAVLQSLLGQALELEPHARPAFLDRACAGDSAMRADLEGLLRIDDSAGEFLDQPAIAIAPELWVDEPAAAEPAMEGRRIGAWRLLREIGRGGMGAVYLAERADGAFEQRAALKLIKRGLDTDEILGRFQRERQILARLEHPGVARVLDGGATDDGVPYFVMEFVEGEPITRWAERKALSLGDTLELFLRACEPVQYAHRNLIVHRDLKPANVLVDEAGQVKLLDFGVARLLQADDSNPGWTGAGDRRLTPDYAAPEQIRGELPTTATDVYALGVLLYELLAGERPHHRTGASLAEMERAVLSEAAAPPSVALAKRIGTATSAGAPERRRSSWASRVRGDLDRIVLKALHEDPAQRYGVVEAFVEDLRRWTTGEPVLATAPTWRYRTGKLLRRHATAVAVTAVVLVALVAGLAAVGWQASVARRERDRAVREARKATGIKDFMLGLFRAANPYDDLADPELTAQQLVERGTRRVTTEMANDPDVQVEMMDVLAGIQRDFGQFDRAESLVTDAMQIRRRLYGERGEPFATSLLSLGTLRWAQGRYTEAESLLQQSLAMRRTLFAPKSEGVMEALNVLAAAQNGAGSAGAESTYREALALAEAMYPADSPGLALQLQNYAGFLHQSGRPAEARPYFERALAIRTRTFGSSHILTALTEEWLAMCLTAVGELTRADSLYRRVLAVRERWLEPGHADLARPFDAWGILCVQMGRYARAESLHHRAVEIRRAALPPGHPDLVTSQNNLAVAQFFLRKLDVAAAAFQEIYAHWSRTLGPDHASTLTCYNNLGCVRREQGRYDEAERILQDVRERRRKAFGDESPAISSSYFHLAVLEFLRGRLEPAEALARRGLALREQTLGPRSQAVAQAQETLASILRERGRLDESLALYQKALDICREAFHEPNAQTADALVGYGRALCVANRAKEAREPLRQAFEYRLSALGPQDYRTGEAQVALGRCLVQIGEHERGRAMIQEGLIALKRRPGKADPLIRVGEKDLNGRG